MSVHQPPPSPPAHWLWGHAGLLRDDILKWLETLPREYGDVVALRFGAYRLLLLSHPDMVEQILISQAKRFVKPPRFRRLVRVAFGRGLFASEGESWRRQRQLMQAALDEIDLPAHARTVVECVQKTVARWPEHNEGDLACRMIDLTLAVRAKTTLDLDRCEALAGIHQALESFMDYYAAALRSPVSWPLWVPTTRNRKMRAALRSWWSAIDRQIDHAAHIDTQHNHLLARLLARDDGASGPAMSRRQLRDELATWFMTGTETTANTLAWACYLLARHPDQQSRLIGEVDAVLQGRAAQRSDLPRMPRLEWVLLEVMRLYPQAYVIGRKSTEPFLLDDCDYPKGTAVLLNQWSIGRDARWFDRPAEFVPERWSDALADRLPRYAYFPFSSGARSCIGRSLAMLEMPLILASLLQRFRFEVAADAVVRPCPSLTLRPIFGPGSVAICRRSVPG